jgi:hypothetical protein
MLKYLTAAFAFAMLTVPASANETADSCRAYVAENGGDASGCDCLGDAAAADADLAAALAAIEAPADLEAADQSTKDKIAACFPNAQQG